MKVWKVEFKSKGEVKEKLIVEFKGKTIEIWDIGSEEELSRFYDRFVVYKHKITVQHKGKKAFFDFWGSVSEYIEGIKTYDANGLMEVFEILVSEAIYPLEYKDVDDFAEAFGFVKPSEALKAWRGVNNTHKKLKRVLRLSKDEFFELHNFLVDCINEDVKPEAIA